jgi:methylmalonyl-CoA mutase
MDQLSRQEATIEKIRMRIEESVHLTGAVIVGSFAIGNTDPLSDIDLIVVTMPDAFDMAWVKRCELHGDAAITCWDVRDESMPRHGAHKWLTNELVLVDCLLAEPGSGVRLAPPYQILTGGSSITDALVPSGPISRDEVTGELDATMQEALRTMSVEDAAKLGQDGSHRDRRHVGQGRHHGVLGVVADGAAAHDRGASDVLELGQAVAAGVAALRTLVDAGFTADQAAGVIELRLAATDEQFPTIAKLRAARRLWSRVLELSGAPEAPVRVHAVTSRPSLTKYDPWVNMLRGTVAAFAAGVGGAEAVTVVPFDEPLGVPDAFGRRIARNTSSLLIAESHVARVADPAGGSYAVERLTDDVAVAAWAELGRLEQAGGLAAAVADGSQQRRIDEVVAERDRQVALRTRPITGLTEFPNLAESLPERVPTGPTGEGGGDVRRYGAAFEALRDEAATATVFLATMGPVAAHTARATFATNLLAAGGVAVDVAGSTEGPEALAAAHAGQRVAVLAGTDAAYAEWGAAAVDALRAAGAAYVVLAGTPGEKTVTEVDDSCATGVDALAFLTRVREELDQ